MKLLGLLLLVSGWAIVRTALELLHGNGLAVFILAGIATEVLGLVITARAHLATHEDER